MSGLSRTPGKRVGVNSPPRVRIPLSPPVVFNDVFQRSTLENSKPLFITIRGFFVCQGVIGPGGCRAWGWACLPIEIDAQSKKASSVSYWLF